MKVVLLASYAPSLVIFRGALLRAIRDAGHVPIAAAPDIAEHDALLNRLRSEGIEPVDVPMVRTGQNPLTDLRLIFVLTTLMRRLHPSVFLGYTIKPVIFGLIAAWLAGVPRRYALITGLGYAFTNEPGRRARLIGALARALYRFSLSKAHAVIFQNPDDAALFSKLGLTARGAATHVVNGSGVDLEHYAQKPFPDHPLTFLLVARLLKAKGIREFMGAAELVKKDHPKVRFVIVGGEDRGNPDSLDMDLLHERCSSGSVDWLGPLDDVRPVLEEAHVYVLPSYREGTPRSTLEAMATGRAIITTDAPGCRETVIEGENGFLVPVGDVEKLATAMRRFLDEPALFARMGARSLEMARERYDVHKVNRQMLEAMGMNL